MQFLQNKTDMIFPCRGRSVIILSILYYYINHQAAAKMHSSLDNFLPLSFICISLIFFFFTSCLLQIEKNQMLTQCHTCKHTKEISFIKGFY